MRDAGLRVAGYSRRVRSIGQLPSGARRAVWVVGLLVVLAGVLGMHGLSTHGVEAVAPETHAQSHLGSHLGVQDHAGGDRDHGGTHLSPGAVCLAVLLGSVLALLVLGGAGSMIRPWFVTPDRPMAVRQTRSPDPPCLFALSVQRC